MRRLMIQMTDETLHRLMAHSKRSGVPISELVQQAIQAWLGPEEQAICSNTEHIKDIKSLRGKERY